MVTLEKELNANKKKTSPQYKRSLASTVASTYSFDANLAKGVFGKTIKENDLTIV